MANITKFGVIQIFGFLVAILIFVILVLVPVADVHVLEKINITKIVCDDLKRAGYKVATIKKNTLEIPQFHSRGVGHSVPDLFFYDPLYESEVS